MYFVTYKDKKLSEYDTELTKVTTKIETLDVELAHAKEVLVKEQASLAKATKGFNEWIEALAVSFETDESYNMLRGDLKEKYGLEIKDTEKPIFKSAVLDFVNTFREFRREAQELRNKTSDITLELNTIYKQCTRFENQQAAILSQLGETNGGLQHKTWPMFKYYYFIKKVTNLPNIWTFVYKFAQQIYELICFWI
jgi:chromosome segregation ATPase